MNPKALRVAQSLALVEYTRRGNSNSKHETVSQFFRTEQRQTLACVYPRPTSREQTNEPDRNPRSSAHTYVKADSRSSEGGRRPPNRIPRFVRSCFSVYFRLIARQIGRLPLAFSYSNFCNAKSICFESLCRLLSAINNGEKRFLLYSFWNEWEV